MLVANPVSLKPVSLPKSGIDYLLSFCKKECFADDELNEMVCLTVQPKKKSDGH